MALILYMLYGIHASAGLAETGETEQIYDLKRVLKRYLDNLAAVRNKHETAAAHEVLLFLLIYNVNVI